MALNLFKTKTKALTVHAITTDNSHVYVAPEGYTSIIIMAQVANTTTSPITVTVAHRADGVNTELIKNFSIPGNDSASVITGKLVLETGQSIRASASADGSAQIILSILESLNG